MSATHQPYSLESRIAFTAARAASACDLPRQTVDHAIRVGDLPAVRSGRRIVVLRDDLIAWLMRCRERGEIPAPISDSDRQRLAELNRRRTRKPAAEAP